MPMLVLETINNLLTKSQKMKKSQKPLKTIYTYMKCLLYFFSLCYYHFFGGTFYELLSIIIWLFFFCLFVGIYTNSNNQNTHFQIKKYIKFVETIR